MNVILLAQVGAQVIPLVVTTIENLKKILANTNIDPAVYAAVEAEYDQRIAQADAESK